MIRRVARVNSSHLYLENDPSPSLVSHHLRIAPWRRFSPRQIRIREVRAGQVAE